MNESEKFAYVAGLIDGEGTVTLLPVHLERGHYVQYLIISNSNEELIKWLHSNFGGVIKVQNQAKSNLKATRKTFNWILRGNQASNLLEKCYPYLFVKKAQAEIIFEYNKTVQKTTKPLSIDMINKRAELVEKIRELNTSKEYRLRRFEKRLIISTCPNCGERNERERGMERIERYYVKCKKCGKEYSTDTFGKYISKLDNQ